MTNYKMSTDEIQTLILKLGRPFPENQIIEHAKWCFEESFDRRQTEMVFDEHYNGVTRYTFSYKEITRENGRLTIKNFPLKAEVEWINGRRQNITITNTTSPTIIAEEHMEDYHQEAHA